LIGQHCGNYVKGAFESEFIRMKLTLIGIDGSTIWMHADAGSGMFSWASTDVKIERVGANVRVTEIAGSGDIVLLPPGCDSKIQTQTDDPIQDCPPITCSGRFPISALCSHTAANKSGLLRRLRLTWRP
jgi:hypothetical protein